MISQCVEQSINHGGLLHVDHCWEDIMDLITITAGVSDGWRRDSICLKYVFPVSFFDLGFALIMLDNNSVYFLSF